MKHLLTYLESRGVRHIHCKKENGKKPSLNVSSVIESLDDIKNDLGVCKRCGLHQFRTNIVFGEGNPKADLMFIGEGPGEDEDLSGRPFVGKAGKLLTDIIHAMKTTRENVYIANIVKCRPPANRTPMDDEVISCSPFLFRQIASIKPKIIVALGAPATCTLFNEKIKISAVRGRFYEFQKGIKLMPTFHPAYLLRNPGEKKHVWQDMQQVMDYLKLR